MDAVRSQFVSIPSPRAPRGFSVPVGRVQCSFCEKIQESPSNGRCSRCAHALPLSKVLAVAPKPLPETKPPVVVEPVCAQNRTTMRLLGSRICQLRKSRGMKRLQLQARSRISRSFLSRVESGTMIPSLNTLEKLSEALQFPLRDFFSHPDDVTLLCADPFIEEIRKIVHVLNSTQRAELLSWLKELYRIESE